MRLPAILIGTAPHLKWKVARKRLDHSVRMGWIREAPVAWLLQPRLGSLRTTPPPCTRESAGVAPDSVRRFRGSRLLARRRPCGPRGQFADRVAPAEGSL